MPIVPPPLSYDALLADLRAQRGVASVTEYGAVHEAGRDYPLLRLDVPGEHLLVVTTGFHGDERSGPLTVAARFGELAARARARNVGLAVFPCINPSGFERGSRYNASGERPNNDLLRYEIAPGVWKGELLPGQQPLRYELFREGPKETRALRAQLEGITQPIAAALDIHQDNYTAGAHVYAYTFGPPEPYRALLAESVRHATLGANLPVDEHRRIGPDGLIEFYDGSVTDYLHRRGARYAAALETTTETPLEASQRIDLIWLTGFIELAARAR